MELVCGERVISLDEPVVMGVLNVTPDSFSDGGAFFDPEQALLQARRMAAEGAHLIDVGGESTRPGAAPMPEEEECERVIPVIRQLATELTVPISVDSSKPGVMQRAVEAGATLINDTNALRAPGALETARDAGVPVCLMHMQGQPRTMQQHPSYEDVVAEVTEFLADRIASCEEAGIAHERLIVDPGFGFGKTVQHNLQLLKHLAALGQLGCPVLAGLSRKSMIGALLGMAAEERETASVALAVMAAERGAHILRVHDVAPTIDGLALLGALRRVA